MYIVTFLGGVACHTHPPQRGALWPPVTVSNAAAALRLRAQRGPDLGLLRGPLLLLVVRVVEGLLRACRAGRLQEVRPFVRAAPEPACGLDLSSQGPSRVTQRLGSNV